MQPSLRRSRTTSWKACFHERVQPGGRLVEHEQLGVGGEGGDEGDLLPVALGVVADPLGRVEVEPLDEGGPSSLVEPAVGRAEDVEALPAGEPRPERDVAGDIGEPFVERRGLAPRVTAEELDVAAAGADQAEDDPDRRRLARSVGAEEAVDLSGGHLEVEPVEGADRPEGLGQPSVRMTDWAAFMGCYSFRGGTERALGVDGAGLAGPPVDPLRRSAGRRRSPRRSGFRSRISARSLTRKNAARTSGSSLGRAYAHLDHHVEEAHGSRRTTVRTARRPPGRWSAAAGAGRPAGASRGGKPRANASASDPRRRAASEQLGERRPSGWPHVARTAPSFDLLLFGDPARQDGLERLTGAGAENTVSRSPASSRTSPRGTITRSPRPIETRTVSRGQAAAAHRCSRRAPTSGRSRPRRAAPVEPTARTCRTFAARARR